jgi:hypothetical protein
LLAPFIYRDARARWHGAALSIGVLIVAGVMLLQFGHSHGSLGASAWVAVGAVVFAAFAYPLGNRMILLHLERTGTKLGAVQRVFGMTLASWPAWWVLAAITWYTVGPPSLREALLAGGVALSSGVIATRRSELVLTFRTPISLKQDHLVAVLVFHRSVHLKQLLAERVVEQFPRTAGGRESWPHGDDVARREQFRRKRPRWREVLALQQCSDHRHGALRWALMSFEAVEFNRSGGKGQSEKRRYQG